MFHLKSGKRFISFCALGAVGVASFFILSEAFVTNQKVIHISAVVDGEKREVGHITVRYRPGVNPMSGDEATANTLVSGVTLEEVSVKNNVHALRFAQPASSRQAEEVATALRASGLVEFADVMYPLAPEVIGDQTLPCLTTLEEAACIAHQDWWMTAVGGKDLIAGASSGTSSVVVGVLDTGKIAHPDLAGQWFGGYDFLGASSIYNWATHNYENADGFTSGGDSDGRDADPTDMGNGKDGATCRTSPYNIFAGWPWADATTSDWHGTRVAGVISALRGNDGVNGIAPNIKVQPIRVLGKCVVSDDPMNLPNAIDWAAGVTVAGAGTNPDPVDVINLSLGSLYPTINSCPTVYQEAIDRAIARGVAVVASAGNGMRVDGVLIGQDANRHVPSNCNGVISVGATVRNNTLATYSNYGSDFSAPGGDNRTDYADGILSLSNSGTIGLADPGYNYESVAGTSASAPMVSAAIAMALTKYPALRADLAAPAKLKAALKYSASLGTQCTGCGNGIMDIPRFLDALNSTAVPSVARSVNASLVWNGTLNATWEAPVTAQWNPITEYTANAYSAATNGSLLDTCTSTVELSCNLAGITPGASYYISVTAKFNTQLSEASSRVQKTAIRQAAAPTGLTVSAAPEKALVTWTNPTDMGDDNGWLSEAKAFLTETGGSKVTWCYGNISGPGECEMTSLTAGTTYWIEVAAMTQYFPYGRATLRIAVVPASVPTTVATPSDNSGSSTSSVPGGGSTPSTNAKAGSNATTNPATAVKTVSTKVGKIISAMGVLSLAKVRPPVGAKLTMSVPTRQKKICVISKGSIKIVGAGTCTVSITVKPKKGKTTVSKVMLQSTKK